MTPGCAIPSSSPHDWAALFAAERAQLVALLETFAPDDWARPTPCPAWDVLGLCAHLVGDDVGVLARDRDGHFGTPPPEGATEGEFIAWLDELQIEWVRAARRMSPRTVRELLAWTGRQMVEQIDSVDATSRSAHVSWAADGPVPVWLDHGRNLSEYWIHRQQLLEALAAPPDLRPEILEPVFDALRWAYPYRLSKAGHTGPGDVVIDVRGPTAATWRLVARDGVWVFDESAHCHAEAAPVAAQVVLTTDQAWRLLTNNLAAEDINEIAVSDDCPITRTVLRTRAIIGEPNGPASSDDEHRARQ